MQSKNSSQQKARLIVISVFIIGFAAGALSLNLYQRLTSSGSEKVDPRDRTGVFIKKMNDKMKLTADQETRIREILDNTGHKFFEIRKKVEPCMKDFDPQFDAVRTAGARRNPRGAHGKTTARVSGDGGRAGSHPSGGKRKAQQEIAPLRFWPHESGTFESEKLNLN